MEQISHVENPKQLHRELVKSFTEFESGFRRNYPVAWWVTLLAPAVVSGILLVALGLLYGWDYPQKLIAHALMTFF